MSLPPRDLPPPGHHRGALALDLALAQLIRRRALADGADGETARLLALTTTLLAQERGRGHSCLPLAKWAGRRFSLLRDDPTPLPLPTMDAWLDALRSSPLVGDGQRPTPLVLDGRLRLYLYRYWAAEQRLSRNLRPLLERPSLPPDGQTAELFRRLFGPPDAGSEVDYQALAAALALDRGLCLISGGPGTGKTTTVSRILALWLTAQPDLRIALAAPTGKAAARLGESIEEQIPDLPLPTELAERLPRQAATLHRLLAYRRHQRRFLHRPGNPLPCDVLVVDEASMVDLLMMDVLVAALPRGARLVLLGDRDQLTSVETGFVFGDLARGAQGAGLSADFATAFEDLSGTHLPLALPDGDSPLRDTAVELVVNYRFRHQPGIGALATAIRQQDVHRALDVLDDPTVGDANRRSHGGDARGWLDPVYPAVRHLFAADNAEEALRRLTAFRILAVTRRGPWGIEQLNRRVEDQLQRDDLLVDDGRVAAAAANDDGGHRWYPGRPIMVTHNDYAVGLFNGDLGICWPDDGQLRAVFPDGRKGGLRSLPLSKLPPHTTAWAMTVHKSQGSEFDHVLLVLPEKDSPLLGRELLYTAVTRAKVRVDLVADASLLEAGIGRRTRRDSGLLDTLVGGQAVEMPEPETEPDPAPAEEPSQAEPSAAEPSPAGTETEPDPPEDGDDDDRPPEPVQLSLFPDA